MSNALHYGINRSKAFRSYHRPTVAVLKISRMKLAHALASVATMLCVVGSSTAQESIPLEGAILKTIETTTLSAQVAGTIRELKANEGDRVSAGQLLGRINDEAVRLELEQLRIQEEIANRKQTNDINRRLAEKGQQVAQTEYQRALTANARVPNTYPINEIDRLKLVADQAKLEVERAAYEQELAGMEVTLAKGNYRKTYELYTRHQVTAPTAGVVVAVEKRTGEWVEPGSDLLRIVRIDRLRVEGFISAAHAQQKLVGKTATITTSDDSIKGTVVFVSPDVNPVNSQVRVFIEIDNANGKWRPGLRVDVHIKVDVHE